jgi:ABC-type multidrug transport system ATPase subunit
MNLTLDTVELPRGTLGTFSLRFDPGVHVLTGPNGIGKTSLLNAIAGSLPLLAGRIELDGKALDHREARVVLAPNSPPEIPWIRSGLLLDFVASLYPRSRRDAAYADAVREGFGLGAFVDSPLGTLSAGTARKFLLAATLVAAPPVLLFDEPTNDIDAASISAFLDFVAEAAAQRVVIMTTHHGSDLGKLAPVFHSLEPALL